MPSIKLFELGPTRSARVRWMLLEAGLPYNSAGNSVKVLRNAELRSIHPLGKLPAAIIDGKPLFFRSYGRKVPGSMRLPSKVISTGSSIGSASSIKGFTPGAKKSSVITPSTVSKPRPKLSS